jgi:hypothetical protein
MQQSKVRIHQITNHLQIVLGYMELDDYDKALEHFHKTIVEATALGKDLCGVSARTQLAGLEYLSRLKIVSRTMSDAESKTTSRSRLTRAKARKKSGRRDQVPDPGRRRRR